MQQSITHINKAYKPHIGGVESVCAQYVEESKKVFNSVSVLTLHDKFGLSYTRRLVDGVDVFYFDKIFSIYSKPLSISFVLFLIFKFKRHAIYHIHDPFPLISFVFFWLQPRNLMVTYHSDIVRQKLLKRFVDYLRYRVLINAREITTTSETLKRNSDVLSKIPPAKIKVLPIYLNDLRQYRQPVSIQDISTDLKTKFDFNDEYFLVFGRLAYYKGLGVILDAVKNLINSGNRITIPLLIVGKVADSITKSQISQLIQLSEDITYIDIECSEREKIFLLQRCKALLFLSNLTTEAFGILQLEAIAAGKPIVNFNLNTGVPEVGVHGVTALTLDLNDDVMLAKLLAGNEVDEFDLNSLSVDNIAFITNHFCRSKSSEKLLQIYTNLMGKKE